MKNNRLSIYSKLLRDNLTKEGCEFILQKVYPESKSIVLTFHHNKLSEFYFHKILSSLKCTYRMEYGISEVEILIQL